MAHATVTTMGDTPAAAATAAENRTQQQQQHIAQSGVDMCCSWVVMVLGSLHAGAGAWMLGCSDGSYDVYRITRLPHVLQVAQASRYWMTDPDREQPSALQTRPRPLGLHSRSKRK